jgi:hypothetical protein
LPQHRAHLLSHASYTRPQQICGACSSCVCCCLRGRIARWSSTACCHSCRCNPR